MYLTDCNYKLQIIGNMGWPQEGDVTMQAHVLSHHLSAATNFVFCHGMFKMVSFAALTLALSASSKTFGDVCWALPSAMPRLPQSWWISVSVQDHAAT